MGNSRLSRIPGITCIFAAQMQREERRSMTPRVREILSWYGADSAWTLTNLGPAIEPRPVGGNREVCHLAGRSGLRAWAGALLRTQSPGLQSALSLRTRDRSGLQCVRTH